MRKKRPNATDVHVGKRLRMRRIALGLSQQTIASRLGLTFQQLQKYEKGTNRVSASRLQDLTEILAVPVTFFFEGLRSQKAADSFVSDFLASRDGNAIAAAFTSIDNKKLRRSLVVLVKTVAEAVRKGAGKS
jgi:transcriptional regulator with XRE-family HTH domain